MDSPVDYLSSSHPLSPPLPLPLSRPLPLPLPLPPDAANGRISPPRRNPGDSAETGGAIGGGRSGRRSAREVEKVVEVALIFESPEHLKSEWWLVARELVMADLGHHADQEAWWLDAVVENAGLRAVRAVRRAVGL